MDQRRAYKIWLGLSIIAILGIVIVLVWFRFSRWSQKRDFTRGNQSYLVQKRGVSGDFENIQGELLIGPYKDLRTQRYTFFDQSLWSPISSWPQPSFSFWLYNFTYEDAKRRMQELGSKQVLIQWIIENKQYASDGSQFSTLQDIFRDNSSVHMIGDDRLGVNYQHAKTFFTQNRFIIQTANMTYSSFRANRELFFLSSHTGILVSLQRLFQNDWAWRPTRTDALHPNLVVCPINCRDRVESLLESAQTSIYMYQQYIQDENIQTILAEKKTQWLDIKLILGNDPKEKWSVWPTIPTVLDDSIFVQSSPYVHAKAILVDNQFLLVGSMNISPNSLDNNREIGILLLDSELIRKFQNMFLKDWTTLKSKASK